MTSDLHQVMQDEEHQALRQFPPGSFQHVFWQQQKEAASRQDKRGMRWHPAMVKWCLYLRHHSSKAYEMIRQSGCIHLLRILSMVGSGAMPSHSVLCRNATTKWLRTVINWRLSRKTANVPTVQCTKAPRWYRMSVTGWIGTLLTANTSASIPVTEHGMCARPNSPRVDTTSDLCWGEYRSGYKTKPLLQLTHSHVQTNAET